MSQQPELTDSDDDASNHNSSDKNQLFKTVGSITASLKNSILYILIGGTCAAIFLSWQWIDFSTSYPWIILKTLPFLLPLALWGLFYSIITDLADLPNRTKVAKNAGQAVVKQLQGQADDKKPFSFFGKLKRLFRILRSAGNLAAIIDAVKSVVLIINPFFGLLVFISGLILLLLIFTSLLILIF